MKLTSRLIVPVMDDALPMDTGQDAFYFTEGALAYAGYYLHAEDNPLHTHSFVEIAFAVGGAGTHRSDQLGDGVRRGITRETVTPAGDPSGAPMSQRAANPALPARETCARSGRTGRGPRWPSGNDPGTSPGVPW
jgi:hypothetical protein